MSQINNSTTAAVSAAAGVSDARGGSPDLAMGKLDMACKSKAEAQQYIGQIETAQAKKQDCATALRSARSLRRGVRGRATQSEYARAVAACKHARAGTGSVPAWLLKFCKSHGINVETPTTVSDESRDTWSDALDMLEKMQVLNAVCDEAGIDMPVSADKDANRQEWERVMVDLQNRIDSIGAEIHAKMRQIQNCIGEYDSYTQ